MSEQVAPRDCSWVLDGLRYEGRIWGPEQGQPVLALHGWMDHADSFQELVPHLKGCCVVALDLSGHGLSDRRADHATYNIWDDIPQLLVLLDVLGWDKCVLLGHSRGAIVSILLAAAQPKRVQAVIALDALVPSRPAGDVVETMRAFLDDTRKQKSRPPRTFDSLEDYVRRRCSQGNSRQTAEALAGRALERVAEGYKLRGDPRLFASSAMKLNKAQSEAVLRALECPVLNIWAEQGIRTARSGAKDVEVLGQNCVRDYETLELPGDHHFHLDPLGAPSLGKAINDFLKRKVPRAAG